MSVSRRLVTLCSNDWQAVVYFSKWCILSPNVCFNYPAWSTLTLLILLKITSMPSKSCCSVSMRFVCSARFEWIYEFWVQNYLGAFKWSGVRPFSQHQFQFIYVCASIFHCVATLYHSLDKWLKGGWVEYMPVFSFSAFLCPIQITTEMFAEPADDFCFFHTSFLTLESKSLVLLVHIGFSTSELTLYERIKIAIASADVCRPCNFLINIFAKSVYYQNR